MSNIEILWFSCFVSIVLFFFIKFIVRANIEYSHDLKSGNVDKEKDREESNIW